MPTWSGILEELGKSAAQHGGKPQFDAIRRKYLTKASGHSNRDIILYATSFTQNNPATPAGMISITDEDMQGLMEVVHGLQNPNLDLILHSPGGSAEAAEAIVAYLRRKFEHIRVIIPQLAMSAATMMACAADEIVMGKQSSLGPIDPQVSVPTRFGVQFAPAGAVIDQFEEARQDSSDPTKLAAWLPILDQYGPHLLNVCRNAEKMARELVENWLAQFMFHGEEGARDKASEIADWLADYRHFKSHGRHISRDDARSKGLKIVDLENDQTMQDLYLSVFHATTHTFNTGAVKIIENQNGRAFIKMLAQQVVMPGSPVQLPANVPPMAPPKQVR